MFKVKKRTFPSGAFVPTPLRVVAIIHLCIAFSAIFYEISYPFLGQLFDNKRLYHLYESIFANEQLFQDLPHHQIIELQDGFANLQREMKTSFSTKFSQSISILLFGLPPFQKAWLLFSVILPILILIKIDGSHHAAWILPLISAIFLLNQVSLNNTNSTIYEKSLFPTEELVISRYLKQQLPANIAEQQKYLTRGWQLYLIDNWAKEKLSSNQKIFQKQLSKGKFKFNLARIEAVKKDLATPPYLSKRSPLLSLFFFLWSVFFAWFVNRRKWFACNLYRS